MLEGTMSPPHDDPSAQVGRLLAEQHDGLLAFVRARGRGRVPAEDVVQQTAAQALRHAASLRDARAGRAWLFRIARNILADELRRTNTAGVEIEIEIEAKDIDDQLPADIEGEDDGEGERCACVLALARTLKPEYATVLARVDVEGRAVSEVAAELGITANNAMVRLHRARKALAQKLRDHCGTSSLRACLHCVCGERGCCGAP